MYYRYYNIQEHYNNNQKDYYNIQDHNNIYKDKFYKFHRYINKFFVIFVTNTELKKKLLCHFNLVTSSTMATTAISTSNHT